MKYTLGNGCVQIEGKGTKGINLHDKYGDLKNLNNNTIFYSISEVRVWNKNDVIQGVSYKVIPLSELNESWTEIPLIDEDWEQINDVAKAESLKEIDTRDSKNAAQMLYEPFVIKESSIILFNSSIEKTWGGNYALVLVDPAAAPQISHLSATYLGEVEVGDPLDISKIVVSAVYPDGTSAILKSGYTIQPEDLIVHELGNVNVFQISYVIDNSVFNASFIVKGIRKLTGIHAIYDGPPISYGTELPNKWLRVIATYSDGESYAVTDYTFPNGRVVTPKYATNLIIRYKNQDFTFPELPTYANIDCELQVYYAGPPIEVGQEFNMSDLIVKLCYVGENGQGNTIETIPPEEVGLKCKCEDRVVTKPNQRFTLSYDTGIEGEGFGIKTCSFLVPCRDSEVKLSSLEAIYTGPPIYQNKTFNLNNIICKARYNDGTIKTVNNFTVDNIVVKDVGPNVFTLVFKDNGVEKTCEIIVEGLAEETTTKSNLHEINLDNYYPDIVRTNNRYRGPAESVKQNDAAEYLYRSLNTINDILLNLDSHIKELGKIREQGRSVKNNAIQSLNQVGLNIDKWHEDKDIWISQ